MSKKSVLIIGENICNRIKSSFSEASKSFEELSYSLNEQKRNKAIEHKGSKYHK